MSNRERGSFGWFVTFAAPGAMNKMAFGHNRPQALLFLPTASVRTSPG
jgi:hypothetical protein